MEKINLKDCGKKIGGLWQPNEIAFVNDTAIRVAKIKGSYEWHTHKNEDEFFLVIKGSISIDTEKETVELGEWEGYLVKRGLRHRSRADKEALILLIEPIVTKTKGE